MRKNNLKQVGLAMHNYYETFSRFPTHGSNGEPKGQGRKEGLSWRVHLLPFLEQGNLYKQFHLDEPWDSAHNKTLIANMPEVFANPSDKESTMSGKTSIHVFVGPKTLFGGENGSRFRDVTDGTSNTLMAVQAGPDKAEIWTKPGGLAFDPNKNPVELLGKVGKEFLAVFCDGYSTAIRSTIKPETLKLLIQHNDHQRIIPDPAVERFRRYDGSRESFKTRKSYDKTLSIEKIPGR